MGHGYVLAKPRPRGRRKKVRKLAKRQSATFMEKLFIISLWGFRLGGIHVKPPFLRHVYDILFWASLGSPWGVGSLCWVIDSKNYFRPPQKTTTGTSNFRCGKRRLLTRSGAMSCFCASTPLRILCGYSISGDAVCACAHGAAKTPIPPGTCLPGVSLQLGTAGRPGRTPQLKNEKTHVSIGAFPKSSSAFEAGVPRETWFMQSCV